MLNEKQDALCAQSEWDFSSLRALFINCTLKRSPAVSHTQGLADVALEIMRKNGVQTDSVRLVDHTIARLFFTSDYYYSVLKERLEQGYRILQEALGDGR